MRGAIRLNDNGWGEKQRGEKGWWCERRRQEREEETINCDVGYLTCGDEACLGVRCLMCGGGRYVSNLFIFCRYEIQNLDHLRVVMSDPSLHMEPSPAIWLFPWAGRKGGWGRPESSIIINVFEAILRNNADFPEGRPASPPGCLVHVGSRGHG